MWQVLDDELHPRGLQVVAVALDAGGPAAVGRRIRPTPEDLDAVPGPLVQAWGLEEWARRTPPRYPCLIDEEHVVSPLYGIDNVPSAVWIDEEGRIVRPAESPGSGDQFRRIDRETGRIPQADAAQSIARRRAYWDALRDWVDNGARSRFALDEGEVLARMRRPDEDDVGAALHARLGHHLFTAGAPEPARRHYEQAARLSPESWTYFRQSMVLEDGDVGEINRHPAFYERVAALGDRPYHRPNDITPTGR